VAERTPDLYNKSSAPLRRGLTAPTVAPPSGLSASILEHARYAMVGTLRAMDERAWHRELGSTRLRVSAIGLGLAALGRPGYLNLGHGEDLGDDRSVEALEHHAHEVLDAALDAGVGYYDAARSYGRAEAFLGSWLELRRIAPGAVTVGSKWGYTYTADWQVDADPPEVKDLTLDAFRRQLQETRELLGPWLSLYQIHSATLESGVLDDRQLLDDLAALRASGVAIGLTVTGPAQAATIDRAIATEAFDSVQATWNLVERSAGAALERAHAAGLGVIVKEALANGRLTARGDEAPLLEAAASLGVPPDALALAAALAQPWADVVLSGAATREQLESNLRARDVEWTPELAERLGVLAETPDRYWERRAALPWT
jgi:aryl-alcohol dehydrogenase-like predicted oxidoreductase